MTKFFALVFFFILLLFSWNCADSNNSAVRTDSQKETTKATDENSKNLAKKPTVDSEVVIEDVRAADIQKEEEAKLEEAEKPFEGYPDICAAALREDGYWIHIDLDGNQIGPAYWNMAYNFSCGMACVSKKGLGLGEANYGGWYYFVNQKGEATKYGSDEPMQFYEDLAVVNHNGKASVMTKDGKFLKENLDKLSRYSEGLAAAKQRQLNGYLDKEGSWQFQVNKYLELGNFKEGLAKTKKKGKYGFLNKKGDFQIEPVFENAGTFSEGMTWVVQNNKYGFIDTLGNLKIAYQYDDVGKFVGGLCSVSKDGLWGYINQNGDQVIPLQFKAAVDFSEGLAGVYNGEQVGYINRQGKFVIPYKFYGARDFHHGRAIFSTTEGVGYIDTTGTIVIPAKFTKLHNFITISETDENIYRK